MLPTLRTVSLALLCLFGSASQISAAPIMWQVSGSISHLTDSAGVLDSIDVGVPWLLEFTFNPDALGHNVHPSLPTTYYYADAIGATRFQLGDVVYTSAGGDIAVNYGLPIGNGVSNVSGQGLVQFQWLQGWSGGQGGPDLNWGVGLLLASYNDVNATNGQIPTFPNPDSIQSALAGLLWDASPGSGFGPQFTAPFEPTPVPEPTSLLLLGSGIAALIAGRARRAAPRSGRQQ